LSDKSASTVSDKLSTIGRWDEDTKSETQDFLLSKDRRIEEWRSWYRHNSEYQANLDKEDAVHGLVSEY